MESERFEAAVRQFQQRTPFTPFCVSLVNGKTITVDHPEALVVRAGVAAYIDRSGIPSLFDHESVAEVSGTLETSDL